MPDLHEISFQLGEIRGSLDAISRNTAEIKTEVKNIGGRVTTIEKQNEFEKGADSQNKKLASVLGSLFGAIFGGLTAWLFRGD